MFQNKDTNGKTYKRGPLVATLLIGTFCTILNQTILATAFPTLMETFHIATTTVQWLSTGFLLVNGIMIPITAFLIGRIPTKTLYFIAMLIFFVGTLVCYVAPDFQTLLVGRLVQAVGVGVTMPMLQTIMLTVYPPEKRGASMGLAGLVIGLAPAIGPTLSGYIVDHSSWRNLFGLLLPIVFLVLVSTILFMKNVMETKKSRLDVLSIILSSLGFGGLLYGFSNVGEYGWLNQHVLGYILAGFLFLLLFSVRQLTMKTPFLNIRVFQYKTFTLSTMISSVVMVALIGAEMVLPIYLQSVRGLTAFDSGMVLLFGALLMGVMSPVTGRIFDSHGGKKLMVTGLLLLALGSLPFIFLTAKTSVLYIIFFYALRMFGISMVMMPSTTSGMNALPNALITHGTAANNTIRQVASSIGTAVLISILTNVTKANAPLPSLKIEDPIRFGQESLQSVIQGYHASFVLAFSFACLALLMTLFLKEGSKQSGEVMK
ncbi:MAG: multidrug efflux MFS transporter [Streptococcaceae bacterium]|jgi:EmrB/QacA subfamily drug resistance transporter|nr:multidrug efflux MFS transporter [Streptococcaceae bacterium]